MRFEAVDRRRTDDFLTWLVAFGLGNDPCFLGQVGGQRMIVVVGVLERMAQHEFGLHSTKHVREAEQGVLVGAHRVIADVEKFDAGAQNVRSRLSFLATSRLDLVFSHFRALAPQLGRLPAFAERQANDMHGVTLGRVQGNGATGTPDKIGGVSTDYQGGFAIFSIHGWEKSLINVPKC
jgi:hypothetical protein